MKAGSQDQFFKIAWEFSRDFLQSLCKSNKRNVSVSEPKKTVDDLDLTFKGGQCQLIGIFGVEKGTNWRHVVGTGTFKKQPVYFDANDGQYSSVTAVDVRSLIKRYPGIKNCIVYTVT
jgi:hypothetical protein